MHVVDLSFWIKQLHAMLKRVGFNDLLELRSLADNGKVSPRSKVLFPCGQLSLETVPKRLAEAGY